MTRHFVYQRAWATSNVFEAFFTRLKKDVFWLIFWMSVIDGLKSFFKVVFKCCKKTSFGFSSGDQLQMSWICFDWLRLITNSRQDSRLYNCPKSRTQSRIFNSWLIMSVNSIFAVKKKNDMKMKRSSHTGNSSIHKVLSIVFEKNLESSLS